MTTFPETPDPLSVSCPDCAALKGKPCVYLWPKNWDGTPRARYEWLSAGILAKMDKAGTPMKRFHGGRHNKARYTAQVARRKAREAEYAARHALDGDRDAILKANAQAVLDEQRQLIAWLTDHAHILTRGAD